MFFQSILFLRHFRKFNQDRYSYTWVIHDLTVFRNPGDQYLTCSTNSQQESVSKQAYNAALIAWSQGAGSSCQMPCQTTSLTLKKLYQADILSNYSDCLRYFVSCSIIHFRLNYCLIWHLHQRGCALRCSDFEFFHISLDINPFMVAYGP